MTKNPSTAKKSKAAKQTTIPGTERKGIPSVEKAASSLRETRLERMDLQKVEKKKQDLLVEEMNKAGVKIYKFDDDDEELTLTLKDSTKVSIKKSTSDDEDAE